MGYRNLAALLRDRPEVVLADWLSAYQRSAVRWPGPVDDDEIAQLFAPILESFTEAMSEPRDPDHGPALATLVPGSSSLRELEKSAGFLGARLGAEHRSGFDVAAAFLALRETVADRVDDEHRLEFDRFIEWLVVLALDSLSEARARAAQERMRDDLEQGTPVVLVTPELPAALLLGSPDEFALDAIFARLVLLIVRVGAKAMILDVSGLTDAFAEPMQLALARLLEHRKVSKRVTLVVSGLKPEHEPLWQEVALRAEVDLRHEAQFDRAVLTALDLAGFRLAPKR